MRRILKKFPHPDPAFEELIDLCDETLIKSLDGMLVVDRRSNAVIGVLVDVLFDSEIIVVTAAVSVAPVSYGVDVLCDVVIDVSPSVLCGVIIEIIPDIVVDVLADVCVNLLAVILIINLGFAMTAR